MVLLACFPTITLFVALLFSLYLPIGKAIFVGSSGITSKSGAPSKDTKYNESPSYKQLQVSSYFKCVLCIEYYFALVAIAILRVHPVLLHVLCIVCCCVDV